MALVKATLKAELLKLYDSNDPAFVGYAADVATAATNLANAYDTYASTAQDPALQLMLAPAEALAKAALISTLSTIPPTGTLVSSLSIMDAAFVAYWMAIAFVVVPPNTVSKVTAVIAGGWATGLTATLSDQTMAIDAKCQSLSDTIDSVTKSSVTVTITTPGGPVTGPIS
jgi:hypothetical protein